MTEVWLSTEVEKRSLARAGIEALRTRSFATAPPTVSRPRESGITSINSMSDRVPSRIAPCTAAPSATTSSGSSAT